MIEYGRSLRRRNPYEQEIKFSADNNFDFLQVWYKKGELLVDSLGKPRAPKIKESGFPVIFHALMDINDFGEYSQDLLKILDYFCHREVIIHPVCESEEINDHSIEKLSREAARVKKAFLDRGITVCVENNARIDRIFYTPEEIDLFFARNPELDLLLDIAHIDNYQHLEGIVSIKFPKMLHIADKHFTSDHEHLPLGQGEIDFEYIFTRFLQGFEGKLILEIGTEDEKIIESRKLISKIIKQGNS